jgi:thiamine-phosphate pyrophosphorylase
MFGRRNGRKTDRIVTAAAHSEPAIVAAAKAGVEAVLLSPVFPTASHPGGATLGVVRFARLAHLAASLGLFVYALGGVTDGAKIRRLAGSGASGIASIGYFRPRKPGE